MKRIGGYLALAVILGVLAVILLRQSRTQPIVATPVPSVTASSSPTPVASATPTPTFTQTATPTGTPTASLTPTSTQEETATAIPTATDEPPSTTVTSTKDNRVLIRVVAQVAVFRGGPGRVH